MDRVRVAVLVDLPREVASGGHVKYWERVAQAAAKQGSPIDMTVYFSGTGADEILSPHVRYRFLPPVFSTARLKFLPYVPAHTDLARFHPALAEQLPAYDIIHTTDACFAFARTAERIARWNRIPLVTSFHTDTPAYTEVFTRQTLEHILGKKIGKFFAETFKIPTWERKQKEKRLKTHLRACAAILAMRNEDIALARSVAPYCAVRPMRLGVDMDLFNPAKADRARIEKQYGIAPGKFLALFVGRVDAGKNIPVLMQACASAIARGANLHLIVAGLGPFSDEVKKTLGDKVTLAGWVEPPELAHLYASADCLTVASDIEIGGMIGLEALASGCPVLVSRQSDMAQICGNPVAMHMVESGVEPWVEALCTYTADQDRQKTMRAAALDFRRDNLASWSDVVEQDFIPAWHAAVEVKK